MPGLALYSLIRRLDTITSLSDQEKNGILNLGPDLAVSSCEKACANLVFKSLDPLSDCSRRHSQPAGRFRDGPIFDDGNEALQELGIYDPSSS
jgi:hypothetical protein